MVPAFRGGGSNELVSKPGSRFGQEGTQDKTRGRACHLGECWDWTETPAPRLSRNPGKTPGQSWTQTVSALPPAFLRPAVSTLTTGSLLSPETHHAVLRNDLRVRWSATGWDRWGQHGFQMNSDQGSSLHPVTYWPCDPGKITWPCGPQVLHL